MTNSQMGRATKYTLDEKYVEIFTKIFTDSPLTYDKGSFDKNMKVFCELHVKENHPELCKEVIEKYNDYEPNKLKPKNSKKT